MPLSGRDTMETYKIQELLYSVPWLVVHKSGKIIRAQASAEELLGYPRHALIGMSVDDLVPDDVKPRHPGLRALFHESPQSRLMGRDLNLRAKRKDGTVIPVEVRLLGDEAAFADGFVLVELIDMQARSGARFKAEPPTTLNAE